MTRPIDAFTEQPPTRDKLDETCQVGWYECVQTQTNIKLARWWDGIHLLPFPTGGSLTTHHTDFRGPLVHAPDLEQQLAEANAEIERLREACVKQNHDIRQTLGNALGFPRYIPLVSDAAGICVGDRMAESFVMEAARQLTAAQQAKEAADERAENAEREVRLYEEIYGGGFASVSAVLLSRAEAAEARVKRLENEIRLAEEHYGESAAGFAKTTLDRLAALEAENTRLREQLAGSVGGGAGWQDSASEI